MNWMDWLTRLGTVVPMDGMLAAVHVNWDLLGVAGMYGLAITWLGYRWITHQRQRSDRRPLDAMGIADGFVRLLVSAMLGVLVIVLTLGRAQGRSPYDYRQRF